MLRLRTLPIRRLPWKSSAMKKPPRSRYSRIILALLGGQAPFAHLHGIEPGPVVHLVAVFEIDRLLDRADVDPRQTADGLREVPVGARIILRPERHALAPVAVEPAAIAVIRAGRETSGGRKPTRSFRCQSGGSRNAVVFDARILAGRALERVQRAAEAQVSDSIATEFSGSSSHCPCPEDSRKIAGFRRAQLVEPKRNTLGTRLVYNDLIKASSKPVYLGCKNARRPPAGLTRYGFGASLRPRALRRIILEAVAATYQHPRQPETERRCIHGVDNGYQDPDRRRRGIDRFRS